MEIQIHDLDVGDMVSFGRPESPRDPAIGVITKVNRQTYQIRLTERWVQVKRKYPVGSSFRVAKHMVSRMMVSSNGN